MTLNRVRILSPNYSSRGGARVRLIVLHTAEGATTYQSLGSYFGSSSSGVSSHVGIDDTPNTVGEYVDRGVKAWTASNANPVAVQAELCAFAAWDRNTWNTHPNMLQNCVQWLREESQAFGIPLVKLTPQQAQSNGVGVCQHRDLGSWGGNHSDCGDGFPIDDVLMWAQGGSSGGDDDLPLNDADKQWISKAINDALRQQFAPSGECYGRVRAADNDAIQQNGSNFVRWASEGASQAG